MTFDDILKNTPLHIQNLAVHIRKLIKTLDSRLQESVYVGDKIKILQFYVQDKAHTFFGLQATDKNCTLYIHHSEKINIPHGLKILGNGPTKNLKFNNSSEIKTDILVPYLKAVIDAYPLNKQENTIGGKTNKVLKTVVKKITIENPTILMRKKKVSAI